MIDYHTVPNKIQIHAPQCDKLRPIPCPRLNPSNPRPSVPRSVRAEPEPITQNFPMSGNFNHALSIGAHWLNNQCPQCPNPSPWQVPA